MSDQAGQEAEPPATPANGAQAPNAMRAQASNAMRAQAANAMRGQPATAGAPRPQNKLRFDTSTVKSTYCNVCNATSTREEVVINFGVNKDWDMKNGDMEVMVEHRIILSPFAAKRLQEMINRLISEHESRYGELR